MKYPVVMSPISLGSISVRNRVVITPHVSFYGENHLPTRRLADYLSARARGGVGLITVEASSVHPANLPYEGVLAAYDPAAIPGYREIVRGIKAHGASTVLELAHKGAGQTGALTRRAVQAPSDVPDIGAQEVPRPMTRNDIEEVQRGFVDSAINAMEAGFDGIEIHCTHGYLLQQFLSPLTNRRTDEYGGTLENRMRFLVEVLRRVRHAIGSSKALGVRLAGHELTPGGLTDDVLGDVAKALVDDSLVDYFSVSGGTNFVYHKLIAPVEEEPNVFVPYASSVRKSIDSRVPVIGVGKITSLGQAEGLLADGHVDMVGMTRAHIADPDLVRKSAPAGLEGTPADTLVRPCVGANACIARVADRRSVTCVHNPQVGSETEAGQREAAISAKISSWDRRPGVAVVGAGPAGLKAAETAAKLGAAVTLIERSDQLGGQLRYIGVGDSIRASISGVAEFLIERVRNLGVDINLNLNADATLIRELNPMGLVIATGSIVDTSYFTPAMPDQLVLPGADLPHVTNPDETFRLALSGDLDTHGPLELSKGATDRVLVVEDGIGWRGYEAAALYANRGWPTTLVTSHPRFASGLSGHQEIPYLQEGLLRKHVEIITNHLIGRIDGFEVTSMELNNRKTTSMGEFGLICISRYRKSSPVEFDTISDIPSVTVGDAAAPRSAVEAVYEGYWQSIELMESLAVSAGENARAG